ncbi:MAG: protein-disulfide reductase DsbD domain-containing protein [Methylocella sp.]
MQMSFQLLNGAARPSRAGVAISLLLLAFMAELRADPLASANPYASDWSAGAKSAARLIAAPARPGAPYRAGVEIRLDPGAHTYWRSPGEAGAPPVFDFAGSQNIKQAVVFYPAPSRIDEAGFDLFGYRDDVVFPVDVELADESRPAVLVLSLDYAVCAEICLPVKARAALALPARSGDSAAPTEAPPEAASLETARAKAPLRLDDAGRDAKIAIARDEGAAHPTWRVRVKAEPEIVEENLRDPNRTAADLFVEFPDGWYFESKKTDDPNEFLIVEMEAPDPEAAAAAAKGATDAFAKIPVTITLARPRQSYEFTVDLGQILERSLARASRPTLAKAPDGGKE